MNRVPALPEVERVVEELASEVVAARPAPDALWHIWGPATGGKSTALRLLKERLYECGMHPITVTPPSRTLDSGPAALVEAAVGLKRHALIDGQIDRVCSPEVTWSEKTASLLDWMRDAQDKVVLLCDEPGTWPSAASEDRHFAARADEIAVSLLGCLQCRRVVAGEMPTGMRPRKSAHLGVVSAPDEWLIDASAWGVLTPAAIALQQRIGADLAGRSPLEIRLLVGIVELSSVDDVARWWATRPARRDIARRLVDTVERQNGDLYGFIKKAWRSLAVVRRSISNELLRHLVGAATDERSDALVRYCLLYPESSGHTLHWSLRLDARDQESWSGEVQVQEVHRQLARYYTQSFKERSLAGDPRSLLDEVEAYHHATMSGDEGLVDSLRPFFAEQLDALGRTLSRDFRRYHAAAAVFERACAWEPDDDYAHHYLAFNLDVVAERPPEVEMHYREAIRLAPEHAWWHSRWITYLVTRSRMNDAHRAWNDALDALGLPDPNVEQWIYENLHLWIARLLVHRGQLDFAEDVLRGIPLEVREQHPGLGAITKRMKALVEARRSGAVFPLSIPPDCWWSGPHLCQKRRSSGVVLTRWMPARVDAVDEEEVNLHVADPPREDAPTPTFGFMVISTVDFNRWSGDQLAQDLSAGKFLELAWYGDGDNSEPMIRIHRAVAWEDRDLPPLFPKPERYLRAAGWVRNQP